MTDYASAKRSDAALFARFFHGCLEAGVYLPPSQFESTFVSLAHDAMVLEHTARIFDEVLGRCAGEATAALTAPQAEDDLVADN